MSDDFEVKVASKTVMVMMVTTIILIVLIVSLWMTGKKPESVIAVVIGIFGWAIKFIVDEHFKKMARSAGQQFSEIQKKSDQQFQIIQQGIQAGYGFKQIAMQKMYEITSEIWDKAIWIAGHWNILWPGNDSETDLRDAFKIRYDEYIEFLRRNAINIPSNIYTTAGGLIKGVDEYVFGREKRDDEDADREWRSEGHHEMAAGSKLVSSSMKELFEIIRKEFGLESLPGDILKIPVPEEEKHVIEEAEKK